MLQILKEIMKKLINKIRKRTDSDEESSSRITADTVAEHREKILAGGRKFKYPIQYTQAQAGYDCDYYRC